MTVRPEGRDHKEMHPEVSSTALALEEPGDKLLVVLGITTYHDRRVMSLLWHSCFSLITYNHFPAAKKDMIRHAYIIHHFSVGVASNHTDPISIPGTMTPSPLQSAFSNNRLTSWRPWQRGDALLPAAFQAAFLPGLGSLDRSFLGLAIWI